MDKTKENIHIILGSPDDFPEKESSAVFSLSLGSPDLLQVEDIFIHPAFLYQIQNPIPVIIHESVKGKSDYLRLRDILTLRNAIAIRAWIEFYGLTGTQNCNSIHPGSTLPELVSMLSATRLKDEVAILKEMLK